jgi:hypothetical protein
MPLYLYGPVLQVVDGPALAASDGCCCKSNANNCQTLCPDNNAFYDCVFGSNSWTLSIDTCQAGFVPGSSASCGACNNPDPVNIQQCCVCCVPNGAP